MLEQKYSIYNNSNIDTDTLLEMIQDFANECKVKMRIPCRVKLLAAFESCGEYVRKCEAKDC